MDKQRTTFTLSSSSFTYFLSIVALLLVIINVAGLFMRYVLGHGAVFGLIPLFDFDREHNIPTLFSTSLFLINATLFFVVWKLRNKEDKNQWIWLLLSGLFCFFAIDELSEIHERLIIPVRTTLNTSGFLYFAWVIPYSIAGLLLTIFLIPFFMRIEKKIRKWFAVSALTYIVGAIGVEMIGAYYLSSKGEFDILYGFITTLEESMEISGLIMFIFTLLSLIQKKYQGLMIIIPSASETSDTSGKTLNQMK